MEPRYKTWGVLFLKNLLRSDMGDNGTGHEVGETTVESD